MCWKPDKLASVPESSLVFQWSVLSKSDLVTGSRAPNAHWTRGERRLAHVAHISEEVNAGSDGKVSEQTVHGSIYIGHVSIGTGPRSDERRLPGPMNDVEPMTNASRRRQCDSLGNVLLHLCGCYFDT